MELRTGRHVVFALHAHLVFTATRQGPDPRPPRPAASDLRQRLRGFEVELREFNGEQDHVHLLVFYPPKVRLAKLVNSLKGLSSRLLKKEFREIASFSSVKKIRDVLCTPSYFVGSVGGAPLSILKQYIENQGR